MPVETPAFTPINKRAYKSVGLSNETYRRMLCAHRATQCGCPLMNSETDSIHSAQHDIECTAIHADRAGDKRKGPCLPLAASITNWQVPVDMNTKPTPSMGTLAAGSDKGPIPVPGGGRVSWLFETAAILAPAIVAMIALRDHERKVFSCARRKDHVAGSLSTCSTRLVAASRAARVDVIVNRCPNRSIDACGPAPGLSWLAGWLGDGVMRDGWRWVAGWWVAGCLIAIYYSCTVDTSTRSTAWTAVLYMYRS